MSRYRVQPSYVFAGRYVVVDNRTEMLARDGITHHLLESLDVANRLATKLEAAEAKAEAKAARLAALEAQCPGSGRKWRRTTDTGPHICPDCFAEQGVLGVQRVRSVSVVPQHEPVTETEEITS